MRHSRERARRDHRHIRSVRVYSRLCFNIHMLIRKLLSVVPRLCGAGTPHTCPLHLRAQFREQVVHLSNLNGPPDTEYLLRRSLH